MSLVLIAPSIWFLLYWSLLNVLHRLRVFVRRHDCEFVTRGRSSLIMMLLWAWILWPGSTEWSWYQLSFIATGKLNRIRLRWRNIGRILVLRILLIVLLVALISSFNSRRELSSLGFDFGHFYCSIVEHDLDRWRVQIGLGAIADIRQSVPFVHSELANPNFHIQPHVMPRIDTSSWQVG